MSHQSSTSKCTNGTSFLQHIVANECIKGHKIHLCDDFFSVEFTYLVPFFQRIVWIDKLHDLMAWFFPNKGCQGILFTVEAYKKHF